MYMILTYDEFDSQSSKKAWQVWFPYKIHGFGSRSEAEAVIAEEGQAGNPYWVVQASDPVTPKRTSKVELVRHQDISDLDLLYWYDVHDHLILLLF